MTPDAASTDIRVHWDTAYDTRPETALSWYQDVPQPSLDWISSCRADAEKGVVDVGSGASRLVDHLLAAGIGDVTLVDLSRAALEKVKARLGSSGPNVRFHAGNILDWRPSRTYGLWHDRAMFHFLTDPTDRDRYIDVMRTALGNGGTAIIGTFAEDGPEMCSGFPVQRYSTVALSEVLGPDFRRVRDLRQVHETPTGRPQAFNFVQFSVAPLE